MKKILLISFMFLLCSCNNKDIKDDKDLSFIVSKECQLTDYYHYNGRHIYLVCLDEINKNGIPLRDYIRDTFQTVDDSIKSITDDMMLIGTYRDGGSKLYKKNNLRILVCNTINKEKNIFIGTDEIEYDDRCIHIINIEEIKNIINNTSKIELYSRGFDSDKRIEYDNLIRILSNEETKKIKDILSTVEEYNGPITLPYAGRKIKLFDSNNKLLAEFIYCNSYSYFKIDFGKMYIHNYDSTLFNKIVESELD